MMLDPIMQRKKMNNAITDPYPTLLYENDVRYIYIERDLVAFPGPPFVNAIDDSNILTVPEKLNTRHTIVIE
jgi:hypothetical protein